MRIATWNCARGPLATKRAALERVRPDVVVLTEASRPSAADGDVLWLGEGQYGVAIYCRAPFAVCELRTTRAVPCVYPVRVTGPVCFTLFGVWTWPAPTYKQALAGGLECHRRIRGPRVVAGDFNGNTDFDRPRGRAKWADHFGRLTDAGLVSAYHAGRPFGGEPEPTYYHLWRQDRPFHLDYCFIPRAWTLESVQVGSYADWSSLSDHRPVIVDCRLPDEEPRHATSARVERPAGTNSNVSTPSLLTEDRRT